MAETNFNETVSALFKGMDAFISTKTVVGDVVKVDENTYILPLVDVSFGVGAGAFGGTGKQRAGGAMGGKITPDAVLVIQNGKTRLVSVKNQDNVSRVLDIVPEILDKFRKSPEERAAAKSQEADMEKKGRKYIEKEMKKDVKKDGKKNK
ncbi:MAG: GerW family sporulation protein [Lachnospiraceae bacterium]|nr:GerW family sporulation protein [Lachnospiraceae bacterium]